MTKTVSTVPISSLKPWKGPKVRGTQSTPVTPKPLQSPESPDTQLLQKLKQISSTLKSLQNRRAINQQYIQELPIPEHTYVSTDIPITTLQSMWTQGELLETPEQTAAVEQSLKELIENPNISQEEKDLWMKMSRTNNRTE